MRPSTKRLLSIFGSLVGLFYAVAALFNAVVPAWAHLNEVRADIAEKEAAKAELEQVVAKAQEYLSRAGELERRAAPIDAALPRTPDLASFLAILSAIASQSNVSIDQIHFELMPYREEAGKGEGPSVSRVTTQLALVGRYPEVKAWLRAVESELRLIDLESIDLRLTEGETAAPTPQTPLFATVRLVTYWQQ
jgi:Tfp pilus assembly protein PilO